MASKRKQRSRKSKLTGKPYYVPRQDGEVDGRTIPFAERAAPSQGQSAPKRTILFDDLSKWEQAVVKVLHGTLKRAPLHIGTLADKTGFTRLEVRNALRRLVQGTWVVGVTPKPVTTSTGWGSDTRGWYALTKFAKDRLRRAA